MPLGVCLHMEQFDKIQKHVILPELTNRYLRSFHAKSSNNRSLEHTPIDNRLKYIVPVTRSKLTPSIRVRIPLNLQFLIL